MKKIDALHRDLRAVRHEIRSNLIEIIANGKELNVTEIIIKYYRIHGIEIEQGIISFHLKILRESNLVHYRRDSKYLYYRINRTQLAKINNTIESY